MQLIYLYIIDILGLSDIDMGCGLSLGCSLEVRSDSVADWCIGVIK